MAIVQEVRARFQAEIKGARKAFQDLRQEAKKLAPDAQKSTDKAGDAYEDLLKTTERLKESIEESGDTAGTYKPLQKALQKVQEEMKDTGRVSVDSMNDLQREVKQAGDFLDSFGDGAADNFDDLERAVKDAEKALDRLGDTDLDGVNKDTKKAADGLDDVKDEAKKAEKEVDDLGDEFGHMGKEAKEGTSVAGDAIGKLGKTAMRITGVVAGIFAVDKLKDFGIGVVETTADLAAVRDQYEQVMGDMTEATDKYLAKMSEEWNKHPDELQSTLMQYVAILKGKGIAEEQAHEIARTYLERTVDANAFANEDMADTTARFMGMIKGEYDSVDTAMVNVNATMLDTKAQEEYGKKFAELSAEQQELLKTQEAVRQHTSAGVVGQGAREADSYANNVAMLRNTWNDFISDYGGPLVNAANKGLKAAIGFVENLDGRIQSARDSLAPFIERVRDMFDAFTDNGDGGILERMGLSADSFKPALTFMKTYQEALSRIWAVAWPILKQLGSAIFDTLIAVWPHVRKAIGTAVDFIGQMIEKIVAFWESDGQQFADAVGNVFQGILAVVRFVWPLVLGIIKTVFNNIKGVINGGLNVIMGLVKTFSGLFTGDFSKMWEGLKQVFSGALEFIWNFIQLTFYGRILKGAGTFIRQFRSGLAGMWNGVKALFTGGITSAWQTIVAGWSRIIVATRSAFRNVLTFIRDTWNSIRSITAGVIKVVRTVITKGWNLIRTGTTRAFTGIWNAIRTAFQAAHDFLIKTVIAIRFAIANAWNVIRTVTTTVFRAVWNFIRTIFTTILNTVTTIATRLWRGITRIWNFILNTTRTVFQAVWNAIRGAFNSIRNGVRDSVNNVWNRIRDTWNRVYTFTRDTFKNIYNAIRDRFADIVSRAKELPQKIGDGIGAMASKVTAGVTKVINKLASTLGKGVNGVIGGINWVLGKIGVDSEIPKWTVPQYARGTKGHPGGLAIVGDGKGSNAGRELVRTPDGDLYLSPDQDTLVDLPKGSTVVSAKNTRKLLSGIPQYQNGIGDTLTHLWEKGKGWVKGAADKVLDVFSYITKPGKLLDLALDALGFSRPAGGNFIGDMARGAWDLVKSSAGGFVKKMLSEFGGGSGQGFGGRFRKSSSYGFRRHPITGGRKMHYGDDWAAPSGTPIPAQAGGVVTFAGYHPIRGNYVRVRSGNYERIYQHNSRNAVFGGQQVKQGQIVGYVGSTGSSTGPHLHYEVLRGGRHINPAGHADGGIVTQKTLSWLAEGGWAESVISHDPAKRTSQRAIWEETGKELGFMNGEGGAEAVGLLRRIADAVERGQDLSVIMDDRVVGRILSPIISEYQKRNEARSKRFSAQGRA